MADEGERGMQFVQLAPQNPRNWRRFLVGSGGSTQIQTPVCRPFGIWLFIHLSLVAEQTFRNEECPMHWILSNTWDFIQRIVGGAFLSLG